MGELHLRVMNFLVKLILEPGQQEKKKKKPKQITNSQPENKYIHKNL